MSYSGEPELPDDNNFMVNPGPITTKKVALTTLLTTRKLVQVTQKPVVTTTEYSKL
jgi:hypothetical protein